MNLCGRIVKRNQNIYFMLNVVFRKSLLLSDHEKRHGEAGRAIADNVAHTRCMATNTHSEYITTPRRPQVSGGETAFIMESSFEYIE